MNRTLKSFLTFALLVVCNNVYAQYNDNLNKFLSPFFENGFILLRQDYHLINPDNDKVYTKDNMNYYGRIYTIGVRTVDNNFIVLNEMLQPWIKDISLSNNDKLVPAISNTAYLTNNSVEWERMSFDNSSVEEIIEGKLYVMPGNEQTGFQIDSQFGRKKGFVVWVKANNKLTQENDIPRLSIEVDQLNVNTKENIYLYEIENQPENNVIGGFYLVPKSEETGKLSFNINGLFQKVGGIWKLVSLGKDMPEDYE